MDGMPLTEAQIKTFFDDDNLHGMLIDLTEKGYLVYKYPKKQITEEGGITRRVPDTTKEKGYNIVSGKLSFEFSKILQEKKIKDKFKKHLFKRRKKYKNKIKKNFNR